MKYEKYIKYAIITVSVIAGLLLLPFFLKLFLPFILAFAVASPCQRILNFMNKKLKIHRGISSVLIVTILVSLVSWILFILISQLFGQVMSFVDKLPETAKAVQNTFADLSEKYKAVYMGFSPRLRGILDSVGASLSDYVKSAGAPLTGSVFNAAKKFAVSLPDIVIFFFMFILATFFITKDYSIITDFFIENCPEKVREYILKFKTTALSAFLTYIRAQLILMAITFGIVSVALWIIGADYPFVMGFIIGLIDALPFFGTAIILIPWMIFAFISGNYLFAGGLLITQIIAFVTRQLLEPKIISSQIGIHPLITLLSIYIALKIFGVFGIILGPITALFVVNAYVAAKLKKQQDLK